MDIFKLIKKRRTIRKYKKTPIPKKIINQVIEAGSWAPSPHNSQPWQFIIIRNKSLKNELIMQLAKKSNMFMTSFKILFKNTLKILEYAPVIILVYSNRFLSKKTEKFGEPYASVTHLSEIEGISAAIQNMHLAASSLGLGMAWLTIPLFAKSTFIKLIKTENELLAVLTIGYPSEEPKSFRRRPTSDIVKYEI